MRFDKYHAGMKKKLNNGGNIVLNQASFLTFIQFMFFYLVSVLSQASWASLIKWPTRLTYGEFICYQSIMPNMFFGTWFSWNCHHFQTHRQCTWTFIRRMWLDYVSKAKFIRQTYKWTFSRKRIFKAVYPVPICNSNINLYYASIQRRIFRERCFFSCLLRAGYHASYLASSCFWPWGYVFTAFRWVISLGWRVLNARLKAIPFVTLPFFTADRYFSIEYAIMCPLCFTVWIPASIPQFCYLIEIKLR